MIAGIWAILGVLIAGFFTMWYRLGRLEGRVGEGFKRIDGRLERMDERFSRVNDELNRR